MNSITKADGIYVTEDGNWGGGPVIVVGHNYLTMEQTMILEALHESLRFDYIRDLVDGKDVSKYEEEVE
jgi:hypothetical protein